MENICCVIDAQGFYTNGKFYVRELAAASDNFSLCVEVDTGLIPDTLSQRDLASYLRCKNEVHGLSFRPEKVKAGIQCIGQENLPDLINHIYKVSSNGDRTRVVACKNNQFAETLAEIGVPYISLVKCPTLKELDEMYGSGRVWFCAHHTALPLNKSARKECRCSMRKCVYMWKWIKGKINAFALLHVLLPALYDV
jgi:hypothetical protein